MAGCTHGVAFVEEGISAGDNFLLGAVHHLLVYSPNLSLKAQLYRDLAPQDNGVCTTHVICLMLSVSDARLQQVVAKGSGRPRVARIPAQRGRGGGTAQTCGFHACEYSPHSDVVVSVRMKPCSRGSQTYHELGCHSGSSSSSNNQAQDHCVSRKTFHSCWLEEFVASSSPSAHSWRHAFASNSWAGPC